MKVKVTKKVKYNFYWCCPFCGKENCGVTQIESGFLICKKCSAELTYGDDDEWRTSELVRVSVTVSQ